MNFNFNKIFAFAFASFFIKEPVLAKPLINESILDSLSSIFWVAPIRDLSEDGSMVAWISLNPTAVPLFFPKAVPLFEFMDKGNAGFYTLEQLASNPKIRPRLVFREEKKNYYSKEKVKIQKTEVESLESRLRDLEAKLLAAQTKPVHRPNDDELKAFILEGNEHLSQEKRLEYLTQVITEAKKKTDSKNRDLIEEAVINLPEISSINSPVSVEEFLSIPEPPTLDESEENYPFQPYSSKQLRSVLKLKASVPTPQGTERPAQASDFYLTTQNLHDLLGDLNLNQALAGEVKSVAEIWANAEKDSSINPEIALGVKSILFQAKVGKTRTNPFGEAKMDGVYPDDDYFLIGIDKNDQTGVVTIWSKRVEVAPGENMVELTANDVIYHE